LNFFHEKPVLNEKAVESKGSPFIGSERGTFCLFLIQTSGNPGSFHFTTRTFFDPISCSFSKFNFDEHGQQVLSFFSISLSIFHFLSAGQRDRFTEKSAKKQSS
jgi:hypothetical protein